MPKTNSRIPSTIVLIVILIIGSLDLVIAGSERKSLECSKQDSRVIPPFAFDVGDCNDYGQRNLELTVPSKCRCDCTPCAIVEGCHGYSETGTSRYSWKSRLEPKGEAVRFISLYPTADLTESNYFNWSALKKRRSKLPRNWVVPSCQNSEDGCLLVDGIPCDWCGSNRKLPQ